MTRPEVLGQAEVETRLARTLERGRLASTYLFVGPPGVGKRTFALAFAQRLLCQRPGVGPLDACGGCESCQLLAGGSHPDLLQVAKPAERSALPVELLIGSGERRMQEGLCHDLGLKPYLGGRRIAIIDDADWLNEEGANALLKTLEEPPPRSVLILLSLAIERQLPTVRSRCQVVRFRPLASDVLALLIRRHLQVTDPDEVARLARIAGGSIQRAAELRDPAIWSFRGELLRALADPSTQPLRLVELLGAFAEAGGKEASARRTRLRLALHFAIELLAGWSRTASGAIWAASDDASASTEPDAELTAAILAAAATGLPAELVGQCLERTLDALEQIDRNANQGTLLEAWADALARTRSPVSRR